MFVDSHSAEIRTNVSPMFAHQKASSFQESLATKEMADSEGWAAARPPLYNLVQQYEVLPDYVAGLNAFWASAEYNCTTANNTNTTNSTDADANRTCSTHAWVKE